MVRVREKAARREAGKIEKLWPKEGVNGKEKPRRFIARRLHKAYDLTLGSTRTYGPMLTVLNKLFRRDFRGKRFLELGPGVPVMLQELERRGAIVAGLDADPQPHNPAKIRIERGEIEALHRLFKGEKFNAIISKNTFELSQMACVRILDLPSKEQLEEMEKTNPARAKEILGKIASKYNTPVDSVRGNLPSEKIRIDAAIKLLGVFQASEERLSEGGHLIIQTTGEAITGYHFIEPLLRDAGFEVEVKRFEIWENEETKRNASLFIARKLPAEKK